ncbi:MAG: diguanylate cyclase [Micavibrio sp.]|nr:diguanylate cyclase [Micavibrio sp.]
MQYLHSKEKSKAFAKQVLERIEKEDISPIPQNYELWYVYYAASSPEVVRAIDIMAANKQKITDERCEELHQRFLSRSKDNERVRSAGQKIQETIAEMSGRVSGVTIAASGYGKALNEASELLSHEGAPEKIRATLNTMLDSTHDMIKHNLQLEEELERSSRMMEELQRDLEAVRKQALTDGLTNLANRKAFDVEIQRVIEDAKTKGETFTLVLMDIDHFKSFNDNYGHQVGDQVLRLVAKTLTDGVKGRDFAARYGGEEFAILLPETNLNGGMKVADNLRKVVQGKELVNRNTGDVLGRITLSGGLAEYVIGEEVDQLIERADAALYTAKHNGRNQVAAAPAPSAAKTK